MIEVTYNLEINKFIIKSHFSDREIVIEYHLNKDSNKVWELVERFLNLGYKIELDGNTKNDMGTLLIKK